MKRLSPIEIIFIILIVILILSGIYLFIYLERSTNRLIKKLDEDAKRIMEKWKSKDNEKEDT
ncbi:MAG: hypothetical protein ABIK77_03190 [candidate division WOR-3 bacterium]